MRSILFLLMLIGVLFSTLLAPVYALEKEFDNFTITPTSIGFISIGTPLAEIENEANSLRFDIKKHQGIYTVYDEDDIPIATFTVFEEDANTKPVRTVKTTSSKFKLPNGVSIAGTYIYKLANVYPDLTIYRSSPTNDGEELINFKSWPFQDKLIKDGLIIRYKALLENYSDEYGQVRTGGVYPNEFSFYTTEYSPQGRIESFEIDANKIKVKVIN